MNDSTDAAFGQVMQAIEDVTPLTPDFPSPAHPAPRRPVVVLVMAFVAVTFVGTVGLAVSRIDPDTDVSRSQPSVTVQPVVTTPPDQAPSTTVAPATAVPDVTLPPLAGPEGSFHAVYSYDFRDGSNVITWVHELWFFDDDTWRRSVLEGAVNSRPGDYSGTSYLLAGGQFFVHSADGVYSSETSMDPPWPPQRALDPRDDLLPRGADLPAEEECSESDGEAVAGRPTRKLTCPGLFPPPQSELLELWIDIDTGFVLRRSWSHETRDADSNVITASLVVEVTEIEYGPEFSANVFELPMASRVLDVTWPNCSQDTSDQPVLKVAFEDGQFAYAGPSRVDAGEVALVLAGPTGTQATLVGLATGVTPEALMEGIRTDPYQGTAADRVHLPIKLAASVNSVTVCQGSAITNVPLLPGTYVVLGGRPLNQADLIATFTVYE